MNPFKVGDRVRCVDPVRELVEGRTYEVTAVSSDTVRVQVDNTNFWFFADRFELVQPERPVLDPWAWGVAPVLEALISCRQPSTSAFIAWTRFCYWLTEWNIAAHFLPTEAAARTRASNGRDVPAAGRYVWLPDAVIQHYADGFAGHHYAVAAACRQALEGNTT